MRFDSFAVIDWAGGNDRGPRPVKDAIWTALAQEGAVDAPRYHRNREVAEDWLAGLIEAHVARGRRLALGFDFPFGFPAGLAGRLVGRADSLAVWDWLALRLEDHPRANNRFNLAGEINALFPGDGPFWFNGLRRDVPCLPRRRGTGHGLPEHRRADRVAKAFSPWQLGGAGAVGSQALTGMAALSRLRRRFEGRVAVWPFEPLDRPVALIEVWPSLLGKAIVAAPGEVKDAAQVRTLAGTMARLQADGLLDRALDAPEEARREEGWIFGLSDIGLVVSRAG